MAHLSGERDSTDLDALGEGEKLRGAQEELMDSLVVRWAGLFADVNEVRQCCCAYFA